MLLFLSWIGLGHASGVVINEAFVNPDGADGGSEWVELYNAGDVAVDLTGWQLQAGTSSLSVKHVFDGDLTIAPASFLLVGESAVERADVVADLALGNAGSNADIVRLVNDVDEVVDTLVYGASNADE